LITRLSGTGQIIVRPTSAVRQYGGSSQDSIAAGRALQVTSVLEGSVQRQEGAVRVTVRLLRVSDGQPMWAAKFDEQAGSLFAVEDSIAERVAAALSAHLNEHGRQLLAKRYTDNDEAHQLYLKGRYFWNRRTAEGYHKAIDYFRQAIDQDPVYALAYAGLADCYLLMGGYDVAPQKEVIPMAAAAARRALEIDPGLAEAHASLALVAQNFEWDWGKAEGEYRRALELNPNYATAHHWYGEYIGLMGRFDQGLVELEQARRLDPLSTIISTDICKVLYHARRYDRAIDQCRKSLWMDSGFPQAWRWLASAYWGKGMIDEALAALEKLEQLEKRPPALSETALFRAAAHNRAEALRRVEYFEHAWKEGSVAAYQVAFYYTLVGENDRAFEWLEKGIDERTPWVVGFATNPFVDPIRQDPRYGVLLRRLALDSFVLH
jgi:tetratricopeptide (TPR) repeat protein